MSDEYVKLDQVESRLINILSEYYLITKKDINKSHYFQDVVETILKSLKTYKLDEPEFKVGDEVWFMDYVIDFNKGTIQKKVTKGMLEKHSVLIYSMMACEDDKVYRVNNIYKTKEQAEQALQELNKDK